MNARTVSLALLAAIATAPAFADTTQAGALTRAEVKAEYIRARTAGELDYANEFVTPVLRKHSGASTTSAKSGFDTLPPTAAGQRTEPVTTQKSPG